MPEPSGEKHHGFTNAVVKIFLGSDLSLILILLAVLIGAAALGLTPREEDPQIVVPLADVIVSAPGHSAQEVEQLVTTPLERILYQIDGVEYVYSTSRTNQAVITVRFYVGQDRERSLVKIIKKMNENVDLVPSAVKNWVVKPVEIDDVPIVTLTLTSPTADSYTLRRVAEEAVERLSAAGEVSRAYVVGGEPRVVEVKLDPDRMMGYHVSPLEVEKALAGANVTANAGAFTRADKRVEVEAGRAYARPEELQELVVGVFKDRPVFLKDVATLRDGPREATSYVRHTWGPARGFESHEGMTGTVVGGEAGAGCGGLGDGSRPEASTPAVTIAVAKKKGSNAVWVADEVLKLAGELKGTVIPDDIDMVVTRNNGLNANEKVSELVEGLAVAVLIVIGLLTLGLGWREALIVAVAVPVVFGLTLGVNLLAGYTINRVTLFALILALGLLVDDPIVDVENIARHFHLRKKASREIVLEAVAEIRPPLISATLAVIVSFLPMFFITGMMGPYMAPMALNVPVAMLMSMVVAFTITPWLSYHLLKKEVEGNADTPKRQNAETGPEPAGDPGKSAVGNNAGILGTPDPLPRTPTPPVDPHGVEAVRATALYRAFRPLLAPLLSSRWAAAGFLAVIGGLTLGAMMLAADRSVPLKMLPFDNKNELLLVLDLDRGTTLERTDAAVRDFERYLAGVAEVTNFTSYVGVPGPVDFNGLVRHYYQRQGDHLAEIRVNLVAKKNRTLQSHGLGLRMRDELTAIADKHHARLKIVELPPGPPVIATVTAEVYGRPDHSYGDLVSAARTVESRLKAEPGVVDVDTTIEADADKLTFVADKEKAALAGVSVAQIAQSLQIALAGTSAGTVRIPGERHPLEIELRLPRGLRSSPEDLGMIYVKGLGGNLVPLSELGRWVKSVADQALYHKNLHRVVYVFGETAGRPPADCVVDIQADKVGSGTSAVGGNAEKSKESGVRSQDTGGGRSPSGDRGVGGSGDLPKATLARPVAGRTFWNNGSGLSWRVPTGVRVDFAGEGEWKITLDVFRDLGLAFGAALVMIYIILVAQTGSFSIPVVVMMAIPLTVLGVMPGFWLLNKITGGQAGGYGDPVFFTATGMIGMIALAGIVTRNSVILVDFIQLGLARGRSLVDAILESCVVRLRPILLTALAAMLSAIPITIDPIFSGLAWALIFGLFASTLFTLFVIPVTYWLVYARRPSPAGRK